MSKDNSWIKGLGYAIYKNAGKSNLNIDEIKGFSEQLSKIVELEKEGKHRESQELAKKVFSPEVQLKMKADEALLRNDNPKAFTADHAKNIVKLFVHQVTNDEPVNKNVLNFLADGFAKYLRVDNNLESYLGLVAKAGGQSKDPYITPMHVETMVYKIMDDGFSLSNAAKFTASTEAGKGLHESTLERNFHKWKTYAINDYQCDKEISSGKPLKLNKGQIAALKAYWDLEIEE